jgi:hypothetical protein
LIGRVRGLIRRGSAKVRCVTGAKSWAIAFMTARLA